MRPATILDLIDDVPSDRVAVVLPEHGTNVRYGDLRHQVLLMAEALAAEGVRAGDRVAIALPNGLPMVVAVLAASYAATAAPLNPAYKDDEFRFYLADTGATVLLASRGGGAESWRPAGANVRVLAVESDGDGRAGLAGAPRRANVDPRRPGDPALILHTSGSTGRPKRVPLSHDSLRQNARNIAEGYALTPDDVSLCVMPLFHVHGLVASLLAAFAGGGAVVMPEKFNPLSFWRVVKDHGVTWYSAVPALHRMVLSRTTPASTGGSRLRFIRSCSAPLAPALMRALEAATGVPVVEAYGMTEAAHQVASNSLPPSTRRSGSVGRGSAVRISIMGADGRHLPAGERGEVVIQGPTVIRGYEDDAAANGVAFADGWFRTGDEGVLDDGDVLRLVGRLKEMINRGGEKIAPQEVDAVLLTHPAVAEAVSFGFEHPAWGEEVAAAVVLNAPATEAELLAHCRAQLADFKCPKMIQLVAALPRTATGKIQRQRAAAEFAPR